MKLIVKKYQDGATFRIEKCTRKEAEKLEKMLAKASKCSESVVSTFDQPLPECGPGEPNC